MNNLLVLNAINEAYKLICNEYNSVCDDELNSEYIRVINLLESAIEILNKAK